LKKYIPIVNHSLKYNPSLDGIRGLAILLVLLFHIWPEYVPFGYLGVDLFFLLSGYLITQIIYTKLKAKQFSFKEFYRNRIRRIFPAVIIVLITTIIVGYIFLFPSELENLGNHIKSSAYFYQNFRLIGEVGYWDEAAQLKPLLHFWSLSIEEQFYLFWPFIIYLIYKFRLNLISSLFILFIISFTIPYIAEIDKFYHSLARFWELILGGLLYAISIKYNISISKSSKLFSFYPLVFLGLISFPLYLWHYVIISYLHIFGLDVKEYGFAIIFVSIILSYMVYRYIEIYSRRQTSYRFALFLFIILGFIGFTGKYIYKHKGLPNRIHLESNNIFHKQFIREPAQNNLGLSLVTKVLNNKPTNNYIKATSDDLSKTFIIVMGDSHAHTSYPGLAQNFKKRGYDTLLLSNSACPPYIDGAMGRDIDEIKECKDKIDSIYNFIDNSKNIEKIIFTSRAVSYMYGVGFGIVDGADKKPYSGAKFKEYFDNRDNWNQKKQFLDGIELLFKKFNSNKNRFYFLLENPELGFSPKNCIIRPLNIFPSDCKLTLNSYLERAGEYRSYIYKLSKKYKNITLLDPKNLYCDNKYCYAIRNNRMMYADDDHHSVDGSKLQADYFMDYIFDK